MMMWSITSLWGRRAVRVSFKLVYLVEDDSTWSRPSRSLAEHLVLESYSDCNRRSTGTSLLHLP